MDNERVRRGIDFSNRVGEGKLSDTYKKSLAWWKGGKLNQKTFLFLAVVFILNFITIVPLIGRNVTNSFVSSAVFMLMANIIEKYFYIDKDIYFKIITIASLSLSPVSFYLFVRKIALRHELTALVATLLFILPNPFFDYAPSLSAAIIYGDGAHAVIFSFLPLFLLYVETFIATGIPVLGFITAIGTAIIAILSPFVMFNLLMIYPVLTIAEGFLGNLRVKVLRMIFLMISAFGLSLFWYFPTFFSRGILLSHVVYAIDRSMSLFPLLIPIVPVFGALFFLVFDRRKRLKPIFIGVTLLIIYLMLFNTSKQVLMGGIFTPERYRIELTFAGSITLALIIIITSETIIRELLRNMKKSKIVVIKILLIFITVCALSVVVGVSLYTSYLFISHEPMRISSGEGIGSLVRIFRFNDIPSLIMDLISLGTFFSLLYILKTYPSVYKRLKKSSS